MTLQKVIIFITLVLLNSIAFANSNLIYPINSIMDAEIDKNHNLKLIAHILYPNRCYIGNTTYATINNSSNTIELFHSARENPGMCEQVMTSQYPVVEVKRPQPGTYKIIDMIDSRYLGSLTISNNEAIFLPITNSN